MAPRFPRRFHSLASRAPTVRYYSVRLFEKNGKQFPKASGSGRDLETGKTHPEGDCRAGHRPARVSDEGAEGGFFTGSVGLAKRIACHLISTNPVRAGPS